MKRILTLLSFALLLGKVSIKAQDTIIVTASPVIMQVNPLDTNYVAVLPLEASFQLTDPKGLRVYPAHYVYNPVDSSITLLKRPDSYFIPKAQLDMVAPGFFDLLQGMILNSLQGNASFLQLYNTPAWIKVARP